ncbi:MAG: helix-turn-helix transcriptional regulator, partial [Rickettsiales bacterium]
IWLVMEFVMTKEKNNIEPISEKKLLSEYYANKHRAYNSMMDIFDNRVENNGFNQDVIAILLNVNKGVISRRLNGSANITLKTLSNMATALKCKLNINFEPLEKLQRKNYYSPFENINSMFPTSKTTAETTEISSKDERITIDVQWSA